MQTVTITDLLQTTGRFLWRTGSYKFFIETSYGNYVWHSPYDPGGDNTIRRFNGGLQQFIEVEETSLTQDQGKHTLGRYIPHDVTVVGDL